MLLSQWRVKAPVRDALGAKIMACVGPVLATLEVEPDPHCWVHWGDDPNQKYTIYAPTPAGLASVFVRLNVAGEGPRASAKLIRWSRLQVGELGMETEGNHRLLSFQLDTAVLRGADEQADLIGRFALVLFAAIEGRAWPPFDPPAARRGSRSAGAKSTVKGAPKAAPKPTPKPAANPATRPAAKPALKALLPGKPAGSGPARPASPRG